MTWGLLRVYLTTPPVTCGGRGAPGGVMPCCCCCCWQATRAAAVVTTAAAFTSAGYFGAVSLVAGVMFMVSFRVGFCRCCGIERGCCLLGDGFHIRLDWGRHLSGADVTALGAYDYPYCVVRWASIGTFGIINWRGFSEVNLRRAVIAGRQQCSCCRGGNSFHQRGVQRCRSQGCLNFHYSQKVPACREHRHPVL